MAGMTKEEALKEIDKRYRFWQKHYAPECEKYGEALGLAIEALKQPQADVPDTNVGEITLKQAIEAVKSLKEYCEQISVDTCLNGNCPIGAWCFNDRKSEPTPATWKIPQERTEE